MAAMTPEMLAQFQAFMAAQAAVAAPVAPAHAPVAAPAYPPPPVASGAQPYAPPQGAPPPPPQGAITPQGSAPVDDDYVGDLPPAGLPLGTYDFEVLYVDTKSGESDKGPWTNYRYRFTALAGQFQGMSITCSFSKRFPRDLYNLFECCGRPIVKDASGNVGFRKSAVNGCRVVGTVYEDKQGYSQVGHFKMPQVQGAAPAPGGYGLQPPPPYGK